MPEPESQPIQRAQLQYPLDAESFGTLKSSLPKILQELSRVQAITLATGTTTFDIRNTDVMSVTASAAVTIATISNGYNGQILTLFFNDANVTITDNATGTLNTINLDASFVSSANSILQLMHDGTSWREVARSTGDVGGPATSTDNAIVRWDGTTGTLVQDSVVTIADTTGNMAGVGTLNTHTIQGGTSTLAMYSNNLSVFAATTSLQLLGVISDETGTGVLVFGTAPTFTTSITDPLVIGGTGVASTLTLRSTSGIGATGADIIFQVGNNGATEAMRILNNANFGIGTTTPNGVINGSTIFSTGTIVRIQTSDVSLVLDGVAQSSIYMNDQNEAVDSKLFQIATISGSLRVRAFTDAGVLNQTILTLEAQGRVGVRTPTPSTDLDVNGSARIVTSLGVGTAPPGQTGRLRVEENLGIGTATFGTSANFVFSVANGTAPTTGPADTVQFYSTDNAAANTIPSFFCEGTDVLATGQADSASSVRVRMRINGTVVTLLAI